MAITNVNKSIETGLEGKSGLKSNIICSLSDIRTSDKVHICLTGMRPSGRSHIGHYVGALKNWLLLQEEENIKNNFLIADKQVLGDYLKDVDLRKKAVTDMIIDWLALGLDPKKANFIVQSQVPELSELTDYLTMFTPYSLLTNNPTVKHELKHLESKGKKDLISMGFINYPLSQVADIMLFGGEVIPVGEDQLPHIELSRNIIRRVNNITGLNYDLPKALLSDIPRLVGIDGGEKMSKSLGNAISLTASRKEIKKMVNKMYTDPGKTSISAKGNISNHVVFKYLDIFYDDKEDLENLKNKYINGGDSSIGDGTIKNLLVDVLDEIIGPIRERRKIYEGDSKMLSRIIEEGSDNARSIGKNNIESLKKKLGLIY